MNRLWIVIIMLATFIALSPASAELTAATRTRVNLNGEWRFLRLDQGVTAAGFERPGFDDSKWEAVSVPHTPKLEPMVLPKTSWQGVCLYRRALDVPASMAGKRLLLKFEGAMTVADVWVNGTHKLKHEGGYLPFTIDVTDNVTVGGANTIAVRLDNKDNPEIPPGMPQANLDFCWYGGIYRNVELVAVDPLHVTDPILENKVAGGGVFVTFPEVSEQSATVDVQVHLRNRHAETKDVALRVALYDAAGRVVAEATTAAAPLSAGDDVTLKPQLVVASPALWSPARPSLYTLRCTVLDAGRPVDEVDTRVGIRRFTLAAGAFTLNGQKMFLRGVNRHQEYPFLGYALSDNAQYRDALKIKQAGFDFVRCSHYPPSPAFLDACDELGLVVLDAVPGWQHVGGEKFTRLHLQNIREMIRRDRNHASVLMWETSLNETKTKHELNLAGYAAGKEEFPGDQGVMASWTGKPDTYDVFVQARQHGGLKNHKINKPALISEYGDWEYYANNAGFNQTEWKDLQKEERTSRQRRGDGEKRLLQQATNFQEAHNDNLSTVAIADGLWVMYDYNRGYAKDLESSGPMDILRLPKFGYQFFRSQRDADDGAFEGAGPMAFVASHWTAQSPTQVRVFSNCDEVELHLNGRLIGRRTPDTDKLSDRLRHPPFTFEVPAYESGTLKATGFLGGKASATHEVRTPGAAVALRLRVAPSGRPLVADGADADFVYAEVIDANGTVVPDATHSVRIHVEGAGRLVGDLPAKAEAGIAAVLLQAARTPGTATVRAEADGLSPARLDVMIAMPTGAGERE